MTHQGQHATSVRVQHVCTRADTHWATICITVIDRIQQAIRVSTNTDFQEISGDILVKLQEIYILVKKLYQTGSLKTDI